MASNTKTPVEAAQELTKALADKLNELRKMDLPKTDDAANGGQESKGKVPSVSKQAGGTTDAEMNKDEMQVALTQSEKPAEKPKGDCKGCENLSVLASNHTCIKKDEAVISVKKVKCPGCDRKTATSHEGDAGRKVVSLCPACKKKNIGNVQKMDLPHSDEAANGGKIQAEQARKKEMSSEETPLSEESSATEVHENKKSEHDAFDVAQTLSKAVVEKIATMRQELVKMEQLEKAGNASMNKGIGSLPPATPSVHQLATADQHTQHNIFTILGKGEGQYTPWMKRAKPGKPKAGKDNSADSGSGGDVSAGPLRGELKKDALPQTAKMPQMPTLKPGGVPGAKAGDAPKAPKAPQAPGATMAAKMELPQTDEAAIGGQEKAGMIPAMPKAAGGETDAEKDAGPGPAGSNLAEMNKMTLPHTSAKANGGQMRKDDIGMGVGLSNSEMQKDEGTMQHASPVFAVHHAMFGNKLVPGAAPAAGAGYGKSGVQITQAMPALKPAAAGMHTVGADAPTPAGGHSMGGEKTANMRPPTQISSAAPTQNAHLTASGAAHNANTQVAKSMTGEMKGAGNTALTHPSNTARADMHAQAQAGAFQPKGPVNSGLELARPNKAATLPKFGKDELDAAKCPKCKKGMTLCKCSYGTK